MCGRVAASCGVCAACQVPYVRVWCVGERTGELQRLMDGYKFKRMKAAHSPLAQLLHERLDELPATTVIVPVPTIPSHVRQRGYDHTLLIAKALAKRRGLRVSRALRKITTTRQRGADRATRLAQAKEAFRVKGRLDSGQPYLLVDDITTTGATLTYATQALRDAGAAEVWVAVIARQPLD